MKKLMKKNLAIVLLVIALLVTFATFLYIFKFTNINVFKNVETETKLALQETSNRKAQKFNTFKTLTNLANDAEEGYTIAYDMEDPTNQNVTATIYFLKENVTITNNDGNNTHTFEENGEFIFEFVDEEGNAGTATAKVNWIYKEAPQASILYSTTELTNQDVTVEVYFKDIEIFVFIVNDKYTFEENGEHTFYYEDEAGNTGSITAVVDWIDKDAPVATIEYSEEDPTNQDVVATISFDEENVTITNNDGNNTYTFTDKGEFIFEFVDKAGNTGTAKAKVDWIYKKAPEASIKYSTTELTNQDVTAQVYFKDVEIFVVIANDEYTFTENGTHTFYYEDEAGNTGSITAVVDWIDRDAPVATIEYSEEDPTNQDVVATISFDEENVTITNNDGNNTYTFTDKGEFIFEFVDKAGNTGTAKAKVDWIYKKAPEASIKYSTTELTNQDVTAQVYFKDVEIFVVIANDEYTFTENGTHTFYYEDEAGNTGSITAKVTWIRKEAPVGTIKYSTTNPTNQDVTATIVFDEDEVRVIGGETHTFTKNGKYTFEYVDSLGNVGKQVAEVDWIDKEAPEATITYDIEELTNQNVTATISFNEENVTVTNNAASTTYTFEENDTFTFEFVDAAGNTGTATAEVDWIDKVPPIATIEYDIEDLTNEDVIATISFDKDYVEITNNDGEDYYVFEENGEFTFEYVDEAGNTGSATATVDWIDKVAPVGTITYDITDLTNQNVTATISFNEENVTVTNNEGSPTYIFEENKEFTFEYVDEAGNTGSATATVDWIDKVAPVGTITYDITDLTNQNVTATISFNEENVTVTNNEGSPTYIFEENKEFTFEFVDAAGNTAEAVATVDWIDKVAPVGTITYDINELTNKDVTATITFDKEKVTITNNEGNNTHTFTENDTFTFEFVDEAGNTAEAVATVDWIKKTAPEATIEFSTTRPTNQNVIAKILFDEDEVTVIGGETHTFTKNGKYTFKYVDILGNEGRKEVTVDWIDKEVPVATITYNIEELTNQNVTATISFNEENVIITTGENTHTFEENGTYTFAFVDEAGNAGVEIVTVDWIDKVAPVATITYDIETPTNQDVTATITFDKENVTVTDGNTYIFEENGEYIFEYVDEAGNTGIATATVDWIFKGVPEATIEYDIEDLTNKDVTATITFDRENVTVTGGNTHTFTENGEYTFKFVDAAGNSGELTAEVDWIDKVPPVATIEYDIEDLTNEDVIATISFDKDYVEITNNDGEDYYVFEENGEFTFEYVDEAGNTGSATATVDWIDKVAPVGTITYDIIDITNQDVTATITFDEENVTITNNGGDNIFVFEENDEFTFEFEDEAGNVGELTAIVNWIDKEAPEATIEYDIEELTNQNVTATISFNEENVTITNNEGSPTYTFEENNEFTFEFVDAAGNVGEITAEVDWIDKELPEATIEYSETKETKNPVIARVVNPTKDITIVNNNGLDTYKFVRNGSFTFIIEDSLGNRNEITATVDWIDSREADSEVTSAEYKIEKPYIKNVQAGTKVSEFKSKLSAVAEIVVKDKKGNIAKEDEAVTTGMKVIAGINEYTVVVLGDVDGNGQVTITDLAKLCLHYIGKEELVGAYKEAADLDNNNEITITDLAKLELILVDKNQ